MVATGWAAGASMVSSVAVESSAGMVVDVDAWDADAALSTVESCSGSPLMPIIAMSPTATTPATPTPVHVLREIWVFCSIKMCSRPRCESANPVSNQPRFLLPIAGPDTPLVVAANRDEFHARRTRCDVAVGTHLPRGGYDGHRHTDRPIKEIAPARPLLIRRPPAGVISWSLPNHGIGS
ncbi:MAG: hypothetical protein CME34_19600 [Gordonia sp.]|nr:hypothetical protein [Gordonia sp. (in: high G+C Gram-positive bacteria)]